jgi:hypothetical protein
MADPNKLRKVPTFNPRPATKSAMSPGEPKTLTVKAAVDTITNTDGSTRESPRVVYDSNDMPIPHEDFAQVLMTADLVLAIQTGDLIEAQVEQPEGGPGVDLSKVKLSAEFGGQPTEEDAQALRERQERAEQARQDRLEQQSG